MRRGLTDGRERGKRPGVPPRVKITYEAIMTDRVQSLEEQVAHLQKISEDLSDVVARQETEIALLTRRVAMLLEREAHRETESGGTIPLADQKPPHW